ncbi:MAG: hypothetical protein HYV09_00500 [Deltaproteobacteria bacterium]|nr:hypothetical protein [Deltaproteobacteria bacterium]
MRVAVVFIPLAVACAPAPAVVAQPASTVATPAASTAPTASNAATPPASAVAGPPSTDAVASSSAVPVAGASSAPVTDAPQKVQCTSVDDCWVDGKYGAVKPIARPKKLRGKKFRPCVDGEVAPRCAGGFCATEGYDC